ncbi:MAG: hypothetical protein JXA28_05375 [Bacteroidetes bacterium]|nr:hypothetical protein [Bacteroidota bacterium]
MQWWRGAVIVLFFLVLTHETGGETNPSGDMHFNHIRVEDGLSQGTVSALLHDRQGFMWFGTHDGLNRFDGYRCRVWHSEPGNMRSLSCNIITALAEDTLGRIWIGTGGGGLNMYDPWSQEIHRFPALLPRNRSFSGGVINALCFDATGTLWIGTDGDGLVAFNPADSSMRYYRHRNENTHSIAGDIISDIALADISHLWVGVPGAGVDYLDIRSGHCTHVRPGREEGDPGSMGSIRLAGGNGEQVWATFANSGVYRIYRKDTRMYRLPLTPARHRRHMTAFRDLMLDRSGHLWIVTDSDGLFVRDAHSNVVSQVRHNPFVSASLPNACLYRLYQDRAGNIWIGTNGKGVSFHSPARKQFRLLKEIPGEKNSISISSVRSIYQDSDSVLWLGGQNGFNRIDRRSGEVTVYAWMPPTSRRTGPDAYMQNPNICAIHPDPAAPEHSLLIGTDGDGMYRFDTRRAGFYRLPIGSATDSLHVMGRAVYAFYLDRDGDLWIGSDSGLSCRRGDSGEFEHFIFDPEDPTSLSYGSVRAIHQDRNEHLWIGTDRGGLCHYDKTTRRFTRFLHDATNPESISSNRIHCIYEDSRGMLWIGTAAGLNLMDRRNARFRHYTHLDGLPNDVIYSILEDTKSYLWLSTNRGLARFHPFRERTDSYDVTDGLQGNEFNIGGGFRSLSGELFFGGVNGLTYFRPDDLTRNPYRPPVRLSSCRIGGVDIPLRMNREGTYFLEMEYTDESINFEFAALNFFNAGKNRYTYKLEGMHDHWISAGNNRSINFIALPAGDYTLRIRGSNNDGVWNREGAVVRIRISDPFWSTWWFRLIMGIILFGIIAVVIRWRISLIRSQELELAQTVEERTAELRHANASLLQEIEERKRAEQEAYRANSTKTEFLAHLSHEIRTPMNAILGFTELLNTRIHDEQLRGFLRSIELSGSTLLTLINDILDLSKIEAGRIELELRPVDIRELLHEMEQLFSFQIQQRGLQFHVLADEELPTALMVDQLRIRQILFNLIGNAVKYTEKGSITVEVGRSNVDQVQCSLHLYVKDTGIGISPSQKQIIFEPFRQGTRLNYSTTRGSGLGLAITQRLVSIMGGVIRLDSKLGQGSTFHVIIPNVQIVQAMSLPGEHPPKKRTALSPQPVRDVERVGGSDGIEKTEVLSDERQKVLQELHTRLVEDYLPRWERVCRSHHIQEMEKIGKELRTSAEQAAYPPLLDWSNALLEQVTGFDMDHIPRTLQHFYSVVEQLRTHITPPPQ